MNLSYTIQMLKDEVAKIDAAISRLETLEGATEQPRSRRGRRHMGNEERREVSIRMKRYWANRREGATTRE